MVDMKLDLGWLPFAPNADVWSIPEQAQQVLGADGLAVVINHGKPHPVKQALLVLCTPSATGGLSHDVAKALTTVLPIPQWLDLMIWVLAYGIDQNDHQLLAERPSDKSLVRLRLDAERIEKPTHNSVCLRLATHAGKRSPTSALGDRRESKMGAAGFEPATSRV